MADYYANSAATGSGTGTQASPWTLAQALANTYNSGDRLGLIGSFVTASDLTLSIGTAGTVVVTGCNNLIGDNGFATILAQSGVTNLINNSTYGVQFQQVNLDGGNYATTLINGSTFFGSVFNCNFTRWSGSAVEIAQSVIGCSFTSPTGSGSGGAVNVPVVEDCFFSGLYTGGYASTSIRRCFYHKCTYGNNPVFGTTMSNCVFLDCGTGILLSNNNWTALAGAYRNNIFAGSTTVGMDDYQDETPLAYQISNNAFYNNTHNYRYSTGQSGDVILTADPFVNSGYAFASLADAQKYLALNDVAGGGAACRGAGTPAYLDIGAVQSQGGGGGAIWTPRGTNPNFQRG